MEPLNLKPKSSKGIQITALDKDGNIKTYGCSRWSREYGVDKSSIKKRHDTNISRLAMGLEGKTMEEIVGKIPYIKVKPIVTAKRALVRPQKEIDKFIYGR